MKSFAEIEIEEKRNKIPVKIKRIADLLKFSLTI
tara:strand:+ start:657 stop:758 length:102 start_codon:yes stop_codon:yes gene_type:complete